MNILAGSELFIEKGATESMHFHPEPELLYVLEGTYRFKMQDTNLTLKKEDILVVNSGIRHQFSCDPDAVIARILYDYRLISQLSGSITGFFCNSAIDSRHSYLELRKILQKLVYHYIHLNHKTPSYQISLLYRLLDCLFETFQSGHGQNKAINPIDDERLKKMIHYVNQNFSYGLNLSELAGELFVAPSTLSRLFAKNTGMHFSEYVNQVRLKYAVHDLLYTDKSITKVAVDCGFSSPSAFNKIFSRIYGSTPLEYKRIRLAGARQEKAREQALREQLRLELQLPQHHIREKAVGQPPEIINIDTSRHVPYAKNWNRAINIGSVSNLTLANLQYHTEFLAEHLGFTHARLWNVFSRKMMLCDGTVNKNYNYDRLDQVFDFLVSHHIIPYLDLGRRPHEAIGSAGKLIFHEEEYIDFQSRKEWEDTLIDFLRHIKKRYGSAEVEQWIFEFSCYRSREQEHHYYEDEDYRFSDTFHCAYRAVKKILPNALVGGPLGIIHSDQEFLTDFLETCRRRECVPDFLSFLLFPYVQKETLERIHGSGDELRQIELIHELMERTKTTGCKIFISEWNNTLSNRNLLNDSCYRGAYFISKVAAIWDQADLLCVWMGSDWVSNYHDSTGILNGGSGLLTKDSIRKPAYYAILLLNRLGGSLLMRGEHFIITRQRQEGYQLLCFQPAKFSSSYYLNDESILAPQNIHDVFEEEEPLNLIFRLKHMESSRPYVIKRQTINKHYGNILSEWEKFGFDKELESSDVKYLREITIPETGMEKRMAVNGTLEISATMQGNDIILFRIYEEK